MLTGGGGLVVVVVADTVHSVPPLNSKMGSTRSRIRGGLHEG